MTAPTPISGRKPVTIKDVAARAGVAPGTVSNVLTGRRPVAEPVRVSVLAAVQALDYRPNQLASGLRLKQTRSIGIVVPDLTNPFFASLVQHIELLAASHNFQILLMSSHEDHRHEESRIRALLARQIDGLFVIPTSDEVNVTLSRLPGCPPTILLDRASDSAGHDSVAADNAGVMEAASRYLVDLGHRDIVLLATAPGISNIQERVAGYRQGLARGGLAAAERIVMGGLGVDSCRAAIEQELRRADRPTAILATAYVATLGAIKAIRAVDLAFPEDISLLGFDDSDWMTALRPYVSTIEQPVAEIAERAWHMLEERLGGSTEPSRHVRVRCSLRIRESTRPRE